MKTILLIEDNEEVRENTAEILELENYKVITAENGRMGVELAEREKPDLILCDVMMPVLDGFGTLHLLGKNEDTAMIPFIFLTAKTERSAQRRGMELGADDYLTKPFNRVELLSAIQARFKKKEVGENNFKVNSKEVDELMEKMEKLRQTQLVSDEREVRFYGKNQIIYRKGTHPHFLYFINWGKVKVYRTNDVGKELITAIIGEGEFFGYSPLLEDKAYEDSAEALEESEIMYIPKKLFDDVIVNNSQVTSQFIRLLANKVASKEDELMRLAYNSVRKRVADMLLMINDKYRSTQQPKPLLKINRDDLASIAGTAKESVIRTLQDFKSEKLIDVIGGKITILNEKKLAEMIN